MDKVAIESRLNALKKIHAHLGEEITALEAALIGERSPGQLAKALLTSFVIQWGKRYAGAIYAPAWQKDMVQAKRLIGLIGYDDLEARIGQYLASNDAFYANARHPWSMFVTAVNKFSGKLPAGGNADDFLTSAPADCRHTPPCRTDHQHTQRKQRDLAADVPF